MLNFCFCELSEAAKLDRTAPHTHKGAEHIYKSRGIQGGVTEDYDSILWSLYDVLKVLYGSPCNNRKEDSTKTEIEAKGNWKQRGSVLPHSFLQSG